MTTCMQARLDAARKEISPRAQIGHIPQIDVVLACRGDDLAYYAVRILAARRAGAMCWRCTRLLAAGVRCPEHPYAHAPVMRDDPDFRSLGAIGGQKSHAEKETT